ncbi:MAG: sugar ABC transporter ATP-binding protein [Eubacteriales bacterium]|nr:sugar ABC transporter ATP-binding protein [Eubacteriales bacterium]
MGTLSVKDLTKTYIGIRALKQATLSFRAGEVHALLGENGAGKSTLCKMLSGAIRPDGGSIEIDGRTFSALTPALAKQQGIGMIYQEFNLVPEMTIYENLFLGKELRKGMRVDRAAMIEQTKAVFERLHVAVDPLAKIRDISVAYCQLVEIGKAVLENTKFLIMDEPTAPLTTQEVDKLFELVRSLKEQGVTVIYISHRIEELLELSDRVTILRDGEVITTLDTASTNRAELIRLMVGRELSGEFPPLTDDGGQGEELLRVEGLTNAKIKNVSFTLHRGEILGLAGLVGAGRTETIRAVFGADALEAGQIWIKGKAAAIKNPRQAIENGLALIPEDRKRQGVHLHLSIKSNISLIRLKSLCRLATVSRKKEQKLVGTYIEALRIRLASPERPVSSLSGGNQQKVVLAKWLSTENDILFFDEPTRGIDVGAKKEIYDLMDRLRREGKAIVMVSSEMLEVLGMCNRVLVMHEGAVEGELAASEATQEKILELASGFVETV